MIGDIYFYILMIIYVKQSIWSAKITVGLKLSNHTANILENTGSHTFSIPSYAWKHPYESNKWIYVCLTADKKSSLYFISLLRYSLNVFLNHFRHAQTNPFEMTE